MSRSRNVAVTHPRFPLATLPSPLERARRLEASLSAGGIPAVPRIYLKRDDLLSLGMGGNKIRNLEFSVGAALAAGATDVVTAGRQQSNHCRLTAAACARAGLRAHLVLTGAPPPVRTGNLLLDDLLGATMYFTGSDDRDRRAELVQHVADGIVKDGGSPYVIPVGGSDAVGAAGHALAAAEILQQCDTLGETPSAIVLATATGGTQAGLLAGLRSMDAAVPVLGFAVAKSADALHQIVFRLAADVARHLRAGTIDPAAVHVDGTMLGEGYATPTAAATAAIEALARAEGVFADPVYTGKALAGLLALVRAGRFRDDETVVFLHTGGAPALFADLTPA